MHWEVEAMVNSARGAAQRPMEKIRHEQQAIRRFEELRRRPDGQQLKERVELHELQAGLGENLRARHFFEGLFHHAVGAGVAVMIRLAEHFVVSC